MLNDATYNLMETATVISKGLHRYDTFIKDAADCQHCREIWNHMKRADQEQLERIVPRHGPVHVGVRLAAAGQ